jgi:CDP-diacylglycerol--glycerol-3-phosphate 3-phosphatidyltransferase/cardiolipin synthase
MERQDNARTPLFGPADALTALRLPLAVAFPLVSGMYWRLGIVAVVALSDLIDGMLARRIGGSRAGAVLDPIADKLFMLSAFATVASHGLLTIWELLAVLSRDLWAGIGFLVTLIRGRPTTIPARAGGKWVTVGQLLTLVAFLMESPLVRPLAWATAAISIYAIVDYAREARRRWD